MATGDPPNLQLEIGPDGLAREPAVIAYTQKVIEEEQLQLKKYIQENYSKIRDVERELNNLDLEVKLTAGPKKAALEHLRKKIEMATERIRVAKIKEDQAKKVWEEAVKVVKEEEAMKKKLCEDLNQLVQESASIQFARLEELKRRLEALNPSRTSVPELQGSTNTSPPNPSADLAPQVPGSTASQSNAAGAAAVGTSLNQTHPTDAEAKTKKKVVNLGRGKGNLILPKGRGTSGSGWTGAGFDVDNRS